MANKGGNADEKTYEVLLGNDGHQTLITINTGRGMQILRLTPTVGVKDNFTGQVYVLGADTPTNLIPQNEIWARFERNHGTLTIEYGTIAGRGKPSTKRKLFGKYIGDGKSQLSMMLLSS